jgi:hypothetical protein
VRAVGDGEAEAERHRQQHAAHLERAGRAVQAPRHRGPATIAITEEPGGLADDRQDRQRVERAAALGAGDHARHHRQHDQPEHVVDHRGAQHHPPGRRVDAPEVLEHPGGDADRGRGQHRADEQVGVPGARRAPARVEAVAQRHRQRTPTHATANAAAPTRAIWPEVRLEADLEQQQDHAELAEERQLRVGDRELEAVPADQAEVAGHDAGPARRAPPACRAG